MYAIVRAGGRQEKVAVGDVLLVNKVAGSAGDSIDLTPLLLVDGSAVTSDAAALAKVSVKAEVVGPAKGPKITIMKYKNKTGYRKRQGHRQPLTQVGRLAVKVTPAINRAGARRPEKDDALVNAQPFEALLRLGVFTQNADATRLFTVQKGVVLVSLGHGHCGNYR